mmetsp:Transcript_53799/g.149306  ORF Transcript_53799/g.149306 Transcript_53799/m.149306 type:complete len:218 (-) Transcript_53799:18-671(-)
MLCAWGGSCTALPVAAIGAPKFRTPVCVPVAREKNHTRFGSRGSTWNQELSFMSGRAALSLKEPKARMNSAFERGPMMGATNWKSSAKHEPSWPSAVPNSEKSTCLAFAMRSAGLMGKVLCAIVASTSSSPNPSSAPATCCGTVVKRGSCQGTFLLAVFLPLPQMRSTRVARVCAMHVAREATRSPARRSKAAEMLPQTDRALPMAAEREAPRQTRR